MEKSREKFRQMEDEMSRFVLIIPEKRKPKLTLKFFRFEAEISGAMMGVNSYNSFSIPGFGNVPPPPMPPVMIPHQVNRTTKRPASFDVYSPIVAQPAVVSAKPTIYHSAKTSSQAPSSSSNVDFISLQSEVEKKLKKLKNEKVSAELAISQGLFMFRYRKNSNTFFAGKASSALQSFGPDDYKRRGKNKKLIRVAGGQSWEDPTLLDWQEDDFRIFCGDLGNDVTDELLTRTFNKFPSFLRAKVIRDKRTNKSKGYGFISFKDPSDFTKAMKEMNGKLI